MTAPSPAQAEAERLVPSVEVTAAMMGDLRPDLAIVATAYAQAALDPYIAIIRPAVAASLQARDERIKVLEAALIPFVKAASRYDPPENDDGLNDWAGKIRLGNLRDARTALNQPVPASTEFATCCFCETEAVCTVSNDCSMKRRAMNNHVRPASTGEQKDSAS